MTQDTSQTATPLSASVSSGVSVARLSRRAIWAMVGLVAVTIAALWVAWRWPEKTSLHFWLVTQLVPLVYFCLAWWGVDTSSPHDSDVV